MGVSTKSFLITRYTSDLLLFLSLYTEVFHKAVRSGPPYCTQMIYDLAFFASEPSIPVLRQLLQSDNTNLSGQTMALDFLHLKPFPSFFSLSCIGSLPPLFLYDAPTECRLSAKFLAVILDSIYILPLLTHLDNPRLCSSFIPRHPLILSSCEPIY